MPLAHHLVIAGVPTDTLLFGAFYLIAFFSSAQFPVFGIGGTCAVIDNQQNKWAFSRPISFCSRNQQHLWYQHHVK